MEQDNGRFFNCAESVLIAVNRDSSLEHFHPSALRIALMFGGGIVGTGDTCGAVTGGLMCIGLAFGTDGLEPPCAFDDLRKRARLLGRQFVDEFIENWGSQRCSSLMAMDKGELPSIGLLRLAQSSLKRRCDDYVKWSSERISSLLMKPIESI